MLLHGPTIGVRKDRRGSNVASRADGTEDIGIRVALISGLAWTAATLGPLIDKTVVLSNARLVLEPDLNRRSDRLIRVVILTGKLLGILRQLHYVHRSRRMRSVADALGRGRADSVHAQDRNCGGNQSGRNDDGDLAHLTLLSEMMVTILVATHERFRCGLTPSSGKAPKLPLFS
jgi:hypothetical protein